MGTRATRREERSCARRHARREARVVCICSGGTVGGRVAEAMAVGGKVSGEVEETEEEEEDEESRYRRNAVIAACLWICAGAPSHSFPVFWRNRRTGGRIF